MARDHFLGAEITRRGSGADFQRVSTPADDPAFIPRTAVFVRLKPEWEHIEPFRRYVEAYATPHFGERLTGRVALVVHELLENAVNYCSLGRDIEVDVRVAPAGGQFEVRVANEAVASRVSLLTGEVQRLATVDPAEAYVDAIRRSKRRSQGSCGIGLARLRAEAAVDLSLTNINGWIMVSAMSRL